MDIIRSQQHKLRTLASCFTFIVTPTRLREIPRLRMHITTLRNARLYFSSREYGPIHVSRDIYDFDQELENYIEQHDLYGRISEILEIFGENRKAIIGSYYTNSIYRDFIMCYMYVNIFYALRNILRHINFVEL